MNYWICKDWGNGPEWHIAITLTDMAEIDRDTGELRFDSAVYIPKKLTYIDWTEIESLPDDCVELIIEPVHIPSRFAREAVEANTGC